MYFGTAIFRQLTTAQLQELYRRNGLSALGRRKTQENRLKTAGIAPAATPNDQPVNRQLPSTGLPVQQRANPNAFTEEQITEIKRLVQDSVAAAARDIRDLKQTLEAARWTSTGSKISRSLANYYNHVVFCPRPPSVAAARKVAATLFSDL